MKQSVIAVVITWSMVNLPVWAQSVPATDMGAESAGTALWPDEAVVVRFSCGAVTAGQLRSLLRLADSPDGATDEQIQRARALVEDLVCKEVLIDEATREQLFNQPREQTQLRYHAETEAANALWEELFRQADFSVSEEEVRARYEERRDSDLALPARYAFQHIFIDTHHLTTDEEKAARRAQAEAIYARAVAGEPFDHLAEEFSDGENKSRLIGPMNAGEINPVLDQAILSATEGAILGVLETAFGFHILKVHTILPASVQSFDAASRALRRELEYERQAALRNNLLAELLREQEGVIAVAPVIANATDQLALKVGDLRMSGAEVRAEAARIGDQARAQLESNPQQYLEERFLTRALFARALASGLVTSSSYQQRWNQRYRDFVAAAYLRHLLEQAAGEPTDAAITQELAAHPERYMGPEKRHIAYVRLQAAVEDSDGIGTRYVKTDARKRELQALLQEHQGDGAALLSGALDNVAGASAEDLGLVALREIPLPTVRRLAAELEEGETSAVEMDTSENAVYVVTCLAVRPPEPLPEEQGREAARATLRRALERNARDAVREALLARANLRWAENWESALAVSADRQP